MKKLLLLVPALFAVALLKAQTPVAQQQQQQNDITKIVEVGCGCTTPKWSPGPYAPGETFRVGIGFNGATDGEFHKVVTLFFNGGLQQVIKFHGQTFKTPDNAAPGNSSIEKLKPNPNQ